MLIDVPQPYGRRLDDYRASLSGSPDSTPAHITLVPPTEVDDALRPSVVSHLERVAAGVAPFDVRLRGTGTFRPVSPVVFVGVVAGIGGCEVLAERARSGPLHTPRTFPYHPHVTVAHGLCDADLDRAFDEQASFDAAWTVTGFVLYEHRPDSGWHAVHEFRLRG